jgi:hypothetical protein
VREGVSTKCFSTENEGACPRRTHDVWAALPGRLVAVGPPTHHRSVFKKEKEVQ